MSRSDHTRGGLTGLQNKGNTCYFNSALQCISHTPEFVSYLKSEEFINDMQNAIVQYMKRKGIEITVENANAIKSKTLMYRLFNVIANMWGKYAVIAPTTLHETLCTKKTELSAIIAQDEKEIGVRNEFSRMGQEDAPELITHLLTMFHTEIATRSGVSYSMLEKPLENFINKWKRYCVAARSKTATDAERLAALEEYNRYKRENYDAYLAFQSYKSWRLHVKKNKLSVITEMFEGLYHTQTVCSECNTPSNKFQPEPMVQLSFDGIKVDENKCSLSDLFDLYVKPEKMEGDNLYNCEKCNKKTVASKSTTLWEPPKYLIVHMKRFDRTGRRKITAAVDYPVEGLDISPWVDPLRRNAKYIYDLYAVSNHMGGLFGGHYTAFCKAHEEWHHFDDSSVTPVKNPQDVVTRNGYILFYSLR
jgi:ubiquitin C-terminal hydrolase